MLLLEMTRDKQFLKNKIDYMIKEIDDCINDVMEK